MFEHWLFDLLSHLLEKELTFFQEWFFLRMVIELKTIVQKENGKTKAISGLWKVPRYEWLRLGECHIRRAVGKTRLWRAWSWAWVKSPFRHFLPEGELLSTAPKRRGKTISTRFGSRLEGKWLTAKKPGFREMFRFRSQVMSQTLLMLQWSIKRDCDKYIMGGRVPRETWWMPIDEGA